MATPSIGILKILADKDTDNLKRKHRRATALKSTRKSEQDIEVAFTEGPQQETKLTEETNDTRYKKK